ncbi:MAG: hypothetical protein WD873_08750, partial [Candidatus Hydrogenedentales bacterium]
MRRWWIVITVLLVLLAGGAVAAYLGIGFVREQRATEALQTARAHAEKHEWPAAKRFYREYLHRFPQDTETLREYAQT